MCRGRLQQYGPDAHTDHRKDPVPHTPALRASLAVKLWILVAGLLAVAGACTAVGLARLSAAEHATERLAARSTQTLASAEGPPALAGRRAIAGEAVAEARGSYRSARRTLLLVLFAGGLAGAAGAALVIRGLRRAVGEVLDRLASLRDHCVTGLRGGLAALAEGDLTAEVVPRTTLIERPAADELGDVARALNDVIRTTQASLEGYNASRAALQELVGEVAEGAGTVSRASQRMASTSEEAGRAVGEIAQAIGEVAVGAERQARSAGAVQGASAGVAQTTAHGAEEARETARAARRARELAAEGAEAVAEATAAMTAVRETSEAASEAIASLGDRSAEIGGIVDTIGAIAEQTNLLALNAAIEAARAGEQGRGFAVVAEEVRKLAEEAKVATGSISSLIAEMQRETGRAVSVVEDGAARTRAGAQTVEHARAAFDGIGASVESMAARVEEIAAAVDRIAGDSAHMAEEIGEVVAAAEQASASTEQVSAATQQTSASTQEIAAGAQDLAHTADHLATLVSRFVLTA